MLFSIVGVSSPKRSMTLYLAILPVPGMISLLLSRAYVQLNCYWLPPKSECHSCTLRVILPFWSLL